MQETIDTSTLAAPSGPLIVPPSCGDAVVLSLVVPTCNESENIAAFLSALRDALDPDLAYEVIVVDDDSPDLTWEIAARFQAGFPQLRVVRRRGETGLASAVIRGWQLARGRILGTINADLQHPPAVLPRLVEQIAGADLVVASRFAAGGGLGDWALHRRVNSRVAHRLGRVLLPQAFARTSDPLSGCYIFRREAIAGVELHPLGFKTLMEILIRGRIGAIGEASYEMRARQRGRSKLQVRHWFEYLFHLIRLRRAARQSR